MGNLGDDFVAIEGTMNTDRIMADHFSVRINDVQSIFVYTMPCQFFARPQDLYLGQFLQMFQSVFDFVIFVIILGSYSLGKSKTF